MARLGQEQLLEIFNALKQEMKPYEKGDVKAHFDIEGKYQLVSEMRGMMAMGKPRPEMELAAIIVQSSYVGFYYMPIYCAADAVRLLLSEELLKTLKGKACFHIKKVDEQVLSDVRQAMKVGYDGYLKRGWV